MMIGSSLRDLARLRDGRRKRVSSYDRSGGNVDSIKIMPGETAVLTDICGAGCITHIWATLACDEIHFLRKVVLEMFWDDEDSPSVEVPIGDFFGMGHGICRNFTSLPLTMSPQDGRAFNCYFPMPFAKRAYIRVKSECSDSPLTLYYYIDYEEYGKPGLASDYARFHATWNRQNPCDGIPDEGMTNEEYEFGGVNLTGEGNYVILEAEGRGHYVGCNLNIHNLRATDRWNWYGEGDDMIFIDGEPFPPSLHGTGTEDYFNTAWCPNQEICTPYHGIIMGGGPNWSGKVTLYRFHIEDPIMFNKSIKVTIEHGHANHRSDDYSSTAYWYQIEPHKRYSNILPVEKRLPRPW
ncbi:MAG: DUF2961 domain-containing protein [Firmicutes bacterium]|nr:DUF2961 domain-containing protein [Bacillota bacterium]